MNISKFNATKDLNREDKKKFRQTLVFRTLFLESFIISELKVEQLIISFFNGNADLRIKDFLFAHVFRKLDYSKKITYLGEIIKITQPNDYHKFSNLTILLNKFLDVRNVIAHYPIVKMNNKVGFHKPAHSMKAKTETINNKQKADQEWAVQIKNISVDEKSIKDIDKQFMAVDGFMEIIYIRLNHNKETEKLWKELDGYKDLINHNKKLGIYSFH